MVYRQSEKCGPALVVVGNTSLFALTPSLPVFGDTEMFGEEREIERKTASEIVFVCGCYIAWLILTAWE